ncbi:PepSY domain-containing protein [Amycolatopsis pigmentata]|uniref:PepSY domain-containing protein n=1 Tax=Amycolatopsis pigmentata TaxID=450801 RepID=A0ABW5FJ14_9PSEU
MTTTVPDTSPPGDDPDALSARPDAGTRKSPPPGSLVWMLARRVHFLAGLAVAPFTVVLCLTGLVYAFTPQIDNLLYSHELFVDRADRAAHSLPCTWAISGASRKDSIAVDPYTQQVTARLGWQGYPLLAKLTTLGIQAHSGTLLGLANQIAMALLALGTLVLIALGYRMWWTRRPAGGGGWRPHPNRPAPASRSPWRRRSPARGEPCWSGVGVRPGVKPRTSSRTAWNVGLEPRSCHWCE